MASVVSRESCSETGLEVLSDLGYGGLKLPHGAEAAIRMWSSVDPQRHPVQAVVVGYAGQLLGALDSGRFASAPDGE